jgi:RNA polymerase sigma-70 factor (ECF subfamily)
MRFTGVHAGSAGEVMDDYPVVRAAETFELFFRREYRSILGLAFVLSGSETAAEELAQDAFVAALRNWCSVSQMDNPGAWVRSVVAKRSVSRFRRLTAETKALLRFTAGGPPQLDGAIDERLDLWKEVRLLPRRQRQVIALTYLHDLPREGVAAVLGCSEETVKTHLERARRTLASRLGRSEGGDGAYR